MKELLTKYHFIGSVQELDNSWNRDYVAPDRKETNIYQNFGHKFCLLSHTLHALERNKNPCVLGNLRRKLTICLHDHQDIIFANWRGSSSLTLETINEEASNLWISQNCQPRTIKRGARN